MKMKSPKKLGLELASLNSMLRLLNTGTTDEEYSNTGGEVAYTIASGLTAYLNLNDYKYEIGAGTGVGTTADNGTVTKLTIKASF